MPLFPAPLVVVDFETTGFQHHDWAQPIEIGAVLLDTDGSEIGSFESLIFQVIDDRAYPRPPRSGRCQGRGGHRRRNQE